ncbi:hypothetical protein [Lewinella sp. IMCC34183]|uniref:hypothetical protein n=1 Tax=Lewinella sp. IMCC34183 TaxID=2248762 RepID=UPI00130044F7|nr:hypothetical protein [Lewinella sp. IMCC34183]
MRYFVLLISSLLLTYCASDMAVEEDIPATIYSNPEPRAPRADTGSLTAPDADAPTPYGMTIQPPQAADGTEAVDPSNSTAPAQAAQRLLTGRWVNMDDGEETVEFTPTHYKTFYQGELLVEENMSFHGRCPAACSGGTSTGEPCFTIAGPAQTDCFGIVRLTQDLLELQLLGISSETVVYRRAD